MRNVSRLRVPRSPWTRGAIVLAFLVGVGALLWWHGPHWADFKDAFSAVRWEWVAAAVGLNLLSIVARAAAWDTVIRSAMPAPHPNPPIVFAAFCVGLLANAVLPGRVGELARVAVLTRRLDDRRRPGAWATLVGTVFAHRVFDLVPVGLLVVWVLLTAKIPSWALASLWILLAIGFVVFVVAFATARHHHTRLEGLGTVRRVLAMARRGLTVMREPGPASLAILFQCLGWACQLFAVWTAMRAFHIYQPLPAAGLVLVLMNVATILPLWPGNVGLMQVAVATPLSVQYGVNYGVGFAFGLGLQAIEASVGVGVGLVFLGREGLSFARLREMPGAVTADEDEETDSRGEVSEREPEGARVPG